MKISDLNRGVNIPPQISPSSENTVKTTQQGGFREVMQGIDRSNCVEVLTKLGEDILQQGEVLARRYDIAELKRYKRMLSEFIEEVVRFAYEFKKRSTRDAHGRHHMYATIKKINEKLEKITEDIINQQVDAIELMAAISDINGMVIDLLA